jgi:hypothetical protein
MKKIILLIAIIARLTADPNILLQIDQSQGWFRTGWACMDIWNQDKDSITDLNAWFTNYVAKPILNASTNKADNPILPPNFVIIAANQAVHSNNPWPLINFFFQYVYSINQVINNWISSNQTYLQNVSNACTDPITSTNFDCNLLPSLTLQDLYEPIINDIFNTYGSQGAPSSFANMTSGFGSLGKNFADGTITMNINMAGCGSWDTGKWAMGSSINTNIISVPAWTLFTNLLKTNYSQQVGTNGKSSINSMNTFGSTTNAQSIHYWEVETLGALKCYAGNPTVENCISSWSPATNEFALAGSWQNNPCQAANAGEINSPIMSIGVVHGNGTNGFCLPKQPNWTQFQNPGFMDGCWVTTQL